MTWHERVAWPSISTVQAPHCAIPQPYLVPVIPSVSRKTHSSGVSGLDIDAAGLAVDGQSNMRASLDGETGWRPGVRAPAACRHRANRPVVGAGPRGCRARPREISVSRRLRQPSSQTVPAGRSDWRVVRRKSWGGRRRAAGRCAASARGRRSQPGRRRPRTNAGRRSGAPGPPRRAAARRPSRRLAEFGSAGPPKLALREVRNPRAIRAT